MATFFYSVPLAVFLIATTLLYAWGRHWALGSMGGNGQRRFVHHHSLPQHYGIFLVFCANLPTLLVLLLWLGLKERYIDMLVLAAMPTEWSRLPADQLALTLNNIHNLASGSFANFNNALVNTDDQLTLLKAAKHYTHLNNNAYTAFPIVLASTWILGIIIGKRFLNKRFKARKAVETIIRRLFILCSLLAILTTAGIVLSVLFESLRFFQTVPLSEFLFGLKWSPQTAIRADQIGSSGSFGAVPVFAGTLLITLIAMLVSIPLGLLSAIYLSEYASHRVRGLVKPILELLAGIPTVVYGFFAALTVAPWVRECAEKLGLQVASESALAAGLVMGIMIIPFVSSLSDDVISAVPQILREGSYGLGATQSETICRIVLPAALPGIAGSILLAVSRAIGETMIVVMAAGLAANLTANPLQAVTTVTVQMVTLLTGDQEFESSKTLAAFALGLFLFLSTLTMNLIAVLIVRRYREQYE